MKMRELGMIAVMSASGLIITCGALSRSSSSQLAVEAEPLRGKANTVAAEATGNLSVTQFGAIGTRDDSGVLQKALDTAESRDVPLLIPTGAVVNLRGTVYLGNVTLHARGAVINVYLDQGFQQRGTAQKKNEGAILTKSAAGAGFGRQTVKIAFDTLTINTIRTSDAPGPKTGLLIENVAQFAGEALTVSARGTGHSEVDPLDFFQGDQGVRIERIAVRMDNPGAHGGFWIRNFSPERATADIRIGAISLAGATGDELLSIFNSGDPRADLHDIHIGSVDAQPSGGGGMGVSIYRNAGDYDSTRMQRIAIDRLNVTVGDIGPLADSTGGFAFKVQKCYATIGSAMIRYNGTWTPALPYVFGIRFVQGTGQTASLFIPSITIRVDSRNDVRAHAAAMLYGPIRTDKLIVRGSGSGFRNITNGTDEIKSADIEFEALDKPFFQTREVRGQMNGATLGAGTH